MIFESFRTIQLSHKLQAIYQTNSSFLANRELSCYISTFNCRILIDLQKIMDDDLKRGLINKKAGFDKYYEEALLKVAKIRQKNDAFQKHSGPDVDDQVKQQIHQQSKFIEREINGLKELLNKLENNYRDPESKNKIKQLKADAQKQIERNKIILKDIINKSFIRRSTGKENLEENQAGLMVGGKIHYQNVSRGNKDNKNKMDSLITENNQSEEQQIEIDYELQRKLLLEKNALLNEVQQSTMKIQQIMNDMAVEVQQQGNQLDVISEELMKTNKNMNDVNNQMQQAVGLQKKSRKKYVIVIIMIILVVAVVVGVLIMLNT